MQRVAFRRNTLPPFSGYKSNQSKRWARTRLQISVDLYQSPRHYIPESNALFKCTSVPKGLRKCYKNRSELIIERREHIQHDGHCSELIIGRREHIQHDGHCSELIIERREHIQHDGHCSELIIERREHIQHDGHCSELIIERREHIQHDAHCSELIIERREHIQQWTLFTSSSFRSEIWFHQGSVGRSQWPRGLKPKLSSLARTLGPWVRIPLEALMSLCFYSVFVFPVLGLCRRADHSSQESYRLCKNKDYETG
jgi:hypothetical protein